MNNEELITFEDMQFVDPRLSESEQLDFIGNLRDIQAQNNAQINQQTRALGSDVPLYEGGLAGGEGVFQARYQTPQMNAVAASLTNTARQTALNTALANQETMWKNRYNQAKRALEDAQHNFSTRPSTTTNPYNQTPDSVGEKDPESEGEAGLGKYGNEIPGTTMVNQDGVDYWISNETGEVVDSSTPGEFVTGIGFGAGYYLPSGYTKSDIKQRKLQYERNPANGKTIRVLYHYNQNGDLIGRYNYDDGVWMK